MFHTSACGTEGGGGEPEDGAASAGRGEEKIGLWNGGESLGGGRNMPVDLLLVSKTLNRGVLKGTGNG